MFGKLGLEGDELPDLDLRTSLAGGVGYQLVAAKETTFEVFGGAGLTDTDDSKPPAGMKKNDVGLLTGVNVTFGGA